MEGSGLDNLRIRAYYISSYVDGIKGGDSIIYWNAISHYSRVELNLLISEKEKQIPNLKEIAPFYNHVLDNGIITTALRSMLDRHRQPSVQSRCTTKQEGSLSEIVGEV